MKNMKKFNMKKVAVWTIALVPAIALAIVAIVTTIQGSDVSVLAPVANNAVSGFALDGEAKGLAIIGGGLAGLGMFGSGIGQGYAAGKAAEAVSRNPEAEAKIRSMFLVGAAIAESAALYGFVIAIMAVFVV